MCMGSAISMLWRSFFTVMLYCTALAQLPVCRYSDQFWNKEAWSPNLQCLFELKVDLIFTFLDVSFNSFLWMCFQVMALRETACIHVLKSKTIKKKKGGKRGMKKTLTACSFTKESDKAHTWLTAVRVFKAVACILSSTSRTWVHEPEKGWGGLACKHPLWAKSKL